MKPQMYIMAALAAAFLPALAQDAPQTAEPTAPAVKPDVQLVKPAPEAPKTNVTPIPPPHPPQPPITPAPTPATFDVDKDGVLSEAEQKAYLDSRRAWIEKRFNDKINEAQRQHERDLRNLELQKAQLQRNPKVLQIPPTRPPRVAPKPVVKPQTDTQEAPAEQPPAPEAK